MNELGHTLREAREAQNLSLAEAENRTRIRQKFIAAMETEDWQALPGDVATHGFLRKYAAFLGLDPDEVVALYQRRPNGPVTQPEVSQELPERPLDYRPIELALAEPPPRRIPWRGILLLVVLVVAAAALWWVFAFRPAWVNNLLALPQNLPQPGEIIALEPTVTPSPTEQLNRVTATPTDTVQALAEPTATRAAAAVATSAPDATADSAASEPPPPDVMRLALNVIARAWTRLVIDGQVVSESVMEQGETGEWEARESIVLRTGNAAGVKVSINGEDLPSLGGPGEVVERRWDLVDGQIIETTPSPVPTPSPTEAPTDEAAGTPAATDTPTP